MLARIRKTQEENESGFTLIELLVVMIIIGILAAIAIPTFLSQKEKARESSAKADAKAIATAVETALVDATPVSPATWAVTSTAATETVPASFSIATSPATEGRLSPGNAVGAGSVVNSDGTYCVAVQTQDHTVENPTSWKVEGGQLTKGGC